MLQAREYAPGGLVPTDAPPSSATVVAALTDVNDNPPVFLLDHYLGVVPEDANIGHIVIASIDAFDRDQVNFAGAFLSAVITMLSILGIQWRFHI